MMESGITWQQLKDVIQVIVPFIGMLVWIFTFYARDKKERQTEIEMLRAKLHQLELGMMDSFLKKSDFGDWIIRIDESLRRIHERLDRRHHPERKVE